MSVRVTATSAAIDEIRRLRDEHGPIALFQSGGCCEGSSPMCLRVDEMPPGPGDVLLGQVGPAPVYIDADQDRRWGQPNLVIDVEHGAATSFSLEGSHDLHFTVHTRRAPARPDSPPARPPA